MSLTFETTSTKRIPRRDSPGLETYFRSLRRYPPLGAATERALLLAAQAGDEAASQRLLQHNLRFVVKLALRYQHIHPALQLDDLIQEGTLGLAKAIPRCNPTATNRLITYARPWITAAIRVAVSRGVWIVDTPPDHHDAWHRAQACATRWTQQHERAPTIDELVEALPARDARYVRRWGVTPALQATTLSLAEEWSDEERPTGVVLSEAHAEPFSSTDAATLLTELLAHLPPDQALALRGSFGLDGATGEDERAARRRHQASLAKLREYLRGAHGLRAELLTYLEE